jgi:hypothetical protein
MMVVLFLEQIHVLQLVRLRICPALVSVSCQSLHETPPLFAGIYVANRVSDKLTAVHDYIYCCRSGSAADTQAVSDYVRRYLAEHA